MKVLLVDDHPLILAALQAVIQGLGDDVTVVGVDSAAGARETLTADADFDLVLLDLALGDADGFDVLAELRSTYPALPVVVVSASDRASDVIRAIDVGAMGFVPKKSSNAALFEALRMVMSGGLYVPPMMLGQELQAPPPGGDTVPAVMRPAADALLGASARPEPHQEAATLAQVGLTPRQSEVLALLLQGTAEQADRARTEPVGRDREGPCRRGAARARRQHAHAGGARGEPDDAGPGWLRGAQAAAAAMSATGRSRALIPERAARRVEP